jgi:hypothetical protein
MHKAIQKKRHGILTSDVMLLHDNVCPHTAVFTQALLEHLNWELFDHLPYSPDLALNICHLFTCLKNWLGSQHFSNTEELIDVKTWLSSEAADFLHTDIQKLIP